MLFFFVFDYILFFSRKLNPFSTSFGVNANLAPFGFFLLIGLPLRFLLKRDLAASGVRLLNIFSAIGARFNDVLLSLFRKPLSFPFDFFLSFFSSASLIFSRTLLTIYSIFSLSIFSSFSSMDLLFYI